MGGMRRKPSRLIWRPGLLWLADINSGGSGFCACGHLKETRYSQTNPKERQIERALCPSEFIHDRTCAPFVSGLSQVAAEMRKPIMGDPARAVTRYEAFLADAMPRPNTATTQAATSEFSSRISSAYGSTCDRPKALIRTRSQCETAELHERATNATMVANLLAAIELFDEAKEAEWLADLVRSSTDASLDAESHLATESAAKKPEKPQLGLAARPWCA